MKNNKITSLSTFFFIIALAAGSYIPFINLYLYKSGFTEAQVGILSAIAPLAAAALQPAIGALGDKVRIKNILIYILLISMSIVSILFWVLKDIISIALLMSIFSLAHGALFALSITIALEHLSQTGHVKKFGRIRLYYSLGYAIAGGCLGFIVGDRLEFIFISSMSLCLVALLPLIFIPKVTGKAHKRGKVDWKKLLAHKEFMTLLFFSLMIATSNSFVYSYLPIYFTNLGGSTALYGYSIFIMAGSELPFLIFSGRLINRFGIKKLMLLPIACLIIRFAFISVAVEPILIFFTNVLHGGGIIVVHLLLSRHGNDNLSDDLKSTSQALASIVILSLCKIIGGFVGAFLTTIMNLKSIMITNLSFITLVGIAYLIYLIVSSDKNKKLKKIS